MIPRLLLFLAVLGMGVLVALLAAFGSGVYYGVALAGISLRKRCLDRGLERELTKFMALID